MEQEPLRVFATAHFPWRWRVKDTQQDNLIRANLLVDPRNQAPGMGSVYVVLISKVQMQQVLFSIDAR